MDQSQLQSIVLRALAKSSTDRRLGRGRDYLAEHVQRMCPEKTRLSSYQVLEAYWSLISQGLAYIDMTQPAPENWTLELTGAGYAAVKDQEFNPDDPSGYLSALYSKVPSSSDLVRLYINEAVRTYTNRCYLSCTVMLGVAAEACFMEVAHSFVNWLGEGKSEKLSKLLSNPRTNYIQRFLEFRKKLDQEKNLLPSELKDGLDIQLGAVLDLLRVSRNDAGHPTGKQLYREDCFTALRVFARLLHRLYSLKEHFEQGRA